MEPTTPMQPQPDTNEPCYPFGPLLREIDPERLDPDSQPRARDLDRIARLLHDTGVAGPEILTGPMGDLYRQSLWSWDDSDDELSPWGRAREAWVTHHRTARRPWASDDATKDPIRFLAWLMTWLAISVIDTRPEPLVTTGN